MVSLVLDEVAEIPHAPRVTAFPCVVELVLAESIPNVPKPPVLEKVTDFLDSLIAKKPCAKPPGPKTKYERLAAGLDDFKTASEIPNNARGWEFQGQLSNLVQDRFAKLCNFDLAERPEVITRLKAITDSIRERLYNLAPEDRATLTIASLESMIDRDALPRIETLRRKTKREHFKPEEDQDLKGETNMRVHRERHALKSGLAEGGTTLYGNDPEIRLSAPDVDDDPNNFERLQAEVADQGNAEEDRAVLARECEEADRAFHEGGAEVPPDSKGICEVPDPLSPRSQQAPDELKYDAAPDPEGNESRDLEANEAKYARASLKNGASPTPIDLSRIITPAQLEIFQTNRRISIERYGSARRVTLTEIAKASQKTPANIRQQIRRMRMNSDLKKIFDTVPNVEHVPGDDDER